MATLLSSRGTGSVELMEEPHQVMSIPTFVSVILVFVFIIFLLFKFHSLYELCVSDWLICTT